MKKLAVLASAVLTFLTAPIWAQQASNSGCGIQTGGAQAGASSNAGTGISQNQRNDRAVSSGAQAAAAGSAQANAGDASAGFSANTTIDAELTKSVDARKAKPGDEVTAKVRNDVRQDGKVILHRGTRLVGHVTQAQARANGQASSQLGIIFDRAELKGGQSMDLHAAIQALAPEARSDDSGPAPSPSIGSESSGAGMGSAPTLGGSPDNPHTAVNSVGAAQGVGGAVEGVGRTAGRVTAGATGALNASSRGVLAMPGVQISNELSSATNGTVLVSNSKDIHLDSGTQMVLRVVANQ